MADYPKNGVEEKMTGFLSTARITTTTMDTTIMAPMPKQATSMAGGRREEGGGDKQKRGEKWEKEHSQKSQSNNNYERVRNATMRDSMARVSRRRRENTLKMADPE